jgi:hypothetical protein
VRYLQLLINQSRRATDNVEYTSTSGIQEEEFIQYLNDANIRLHSLIVQKSASIFESEATINAVSGQESYDIPEEALLGNMLVHVEYSGSGQPSDYVTLKQGQLPERFSGVSSSPSFYIRRGGKILLQPQPDESGLIRMTYVSSTPRLDLRRGTVGAVTLTGNSITTLELNPTLNLDKTSLIEENYMTVVDKNGNIKMKGIPFTDINETSGVVTIEPGFAFDTGETIAIGDYVVRGERTSTHSELPSICERYLLEYTNIKILNRDSSDDAISESAILAAIQEEILNTFAEPDKDPDYITILDEQYLLPGDDFSVWR